MNSPKVSPAFVAPAQLIRPPARGAESSDQHQQPETEMRQLLIFKQMSDHLARAENAVTVLSG